MRCCLTSWLSKKQTALAISTTKAKYVSAGKACQQALWMKQALIDYDIRLNDITILCDNKGTIDLNQPTRTTNPSPPQPTFDSIECLEKQPPPILEVMKPPLPPFPPQLLPSHPMSSNNSFPILTHEIFCDHYQRTQLLVNDLRDEMRFILNHILERLNVLSHQNFP
nr:retrotransposon protein [Tanacetum cinerariifolium]